ncbi:6-phospho-beta-glucosidase [Saccharopolyspora erythraea NRRL 2338]|uniref:6-phospho-beta-glucosidase n=2 Tax=Saccharopolyspora erythraea TaxID=1836 RepID=A4FA36_SACEN|nr:6-phospho-beta-glucosidase [Saccharopolyspora erythraea]EQD82815.1 6-phospho-beta-glucosidase [Saccharopolyspora erythraea D]PFG94696.1 6-phospho-beta-glucosidase [Saccharopolyspora erythraea NRRL 2338]QRK91423.1 6-phospho-beta-glucosidase [Saccharopolyspora erythraea]CAM00911.1 6-phospho-beta-glucosidase [Saccharopolyspora erythraea NRRL 2338]
MRLTVVGGGSTYTPELVDGIGERSGIDEIVLVDPDEQRLAVVGGFCRRLLAHAGSPAKLTTTADLERGADGASAVLLQLRVGGQAARYRDETFPLQHGCVGQETTGAGGLAKALRTVPVVLDIAERVREVAPEAWIVNFTNPVGIVTRALQLEGHSAVGLCNVAITFQRWLARLLDVDQESVRLQHVGLNHLTWVRGVRVEGQDVLPRLIEQRADELAKHVELPAALLRRLGAVPSYYLKYFYTHDEVVARQRSSPPRASVVSDVERNLLKRYSDPSLTAKPDELMLRGGAHYSEAAVRLVSALTSGGGVEEHVVNVRNDGTFAFLPDDAVIETNAEVGAGGARPGAVRPVEPALAGLISHVTAYEHLALEAATRGGRDRVAAALLAHPLIGRHHLAEDLADELVRLNAVHLPWAG